MANIQEVIVVVIIDIVWILITVRVVLSTSCGLSSPVLRCPIRISVSYLIQKLVALTETSPYAISIVSTTIDIELLLTLHGYSRVLTRPYTHSIFHIIVVTAIFLVIRVFILLIGIRQRLPPRILLFIVLLVIKKPTCFVGLAICRLRFTILGLLMLSWLHGWMESYS